MNKLRWIALALMLACGSYYAVRWSTTPRSAPLGSFHSIDFNNPQHRHDLSSASDFNMPRDALRKAALEAATALAKQPCDGDNVSRYVQAASNYARAWLAVAPCVIDESCAIGQSYQQLDRVQQQFGTPLDKRVKEAMMYAHKTGAVHAADFPLDVLPIMPTLASDPSLSPQTERHLPSRFGRNKPGC